MHSNALKWKRGHNKQNIKSVWRGRIIRRDMTPAYRRISIIDDKFSLWSVIDQAVNVKR